TSASRSFTRGLASLFLVLFMMMHVRVAAAPRALDGDAAIHTQSQQPAQSGPARVIVTIAVEGLRIPAVDVELRNVNGNVVVGKTTSDVVGQVTFPDVSPGRYVVHAVRDGFADSDSAPFEVSAGETEQGL